MSNKWVVLWSKFILAPSIPAMICCQNRWIVQPSDSRANLTTMASESLNMFFFFCELQVKRGNCQLHFLQAVKSIICFVMSFALHLLCFGELSLLYWSLRSRLSEDPKADQMLFYLLCWVLLNNLCLHTHTCDLQKKIYKYKKELKATNTWNIQQDQKQLGFSVTLFYPQQKKTFTALYMTRVNIMLKEQNQDLLPQTKASVTDLYLSAIVYSKQKVSLSHGTTRKYP